MPSLPVCELTARLELFVADQERHGAVVQQRNGHHVTMRFPSGKLRTLWIDGDGTPAWSDDGIAPDAPIVPPYYCPSCGTFGDGKSYTPGLFLIEVILWFAFIIPGVIYSLWRLSARTRVCRACGAHIVPSDTPVALAARSRR